MDLLVLFVWTILAIRNVSISLPPTIGSSISLFLLSGRHPLSCVLFGRRRATARIKVPSSERDRSRILYPVQCNALLTLSAKLMKAETYLSLSA